MKANLFAIVLSSFIVCLSVHAASEQLNKSSTAPVQKSQSQIDLNKADTKVLFRAVKGIGQKRAEAIVKYRTEHGRFNSIEDLAKVPGFGERFVKNHLIQLQKLFTTN
ncbi:MULTISPECIES: ComEA family DNA-binding protein [Legionella]|uniref:Competence protein ComEA n=1 Tax=Legionella drozanskii LLAP-1 TaxID=1212489 RepID=A0A0W0SQC6_9GAMM|nr:MULTISPECIES: helix-hairpin-helix domain-containing protein [Legionella]KTC85421.1 competence protein ComEA [Legionella drozanskii LLAP-1]PJE16216.1 MAG: competence protein ComEA [Legionella sp.]